jgi:hypothetical protein
MPKLSEIEKTFAYNLRPVLENKTGNWEFSDLYNTIFKLTYDKSISASENYRRKTRNRLVKHLYHGHAEKLLQFAYNILLEADGFGVVDVSKRSE